MAQLKVAIPIVAVGVLVFCAIDKVLAEEWVYVVVAVLALMIVFWPRSAR